MEAQSYMMTLAKDNERLHVLLRKYMEKDDQLHSMSQMSNASGDVAATLGLGHDMDPGTSQVAPTDGRERREADRDEAGAA
eukprot:6433337-Prorocentrum_lima.AAC.1